MNIRKVAIFFSGILLTLLLFIACLPSFLSTSFGKNFFLSFGNPYIAGSVVIKDWDLSWFGSQQISGLEIFDADDNKILDCQNFSTETSLWRLLLGHISLGSTELEGLSGILVREKSGITNIEKAIFPTLSDNPTGSSEIEGAATIEFSDVKAKFIRPKKDNPSLSPEIFAQGLTKKKSLLGNFEVNLAINEEKSIQNLKAQIAHFPVEIIDIFIGWKKPELRGVATAFFGEEINLLLNKTKENEFAVDISSPNYNGQLKGAIQDGEFIVQEPSVQQANFSSLFSFFKIDKQMKAKILIERLILGLDNKEHSLPQGISLKIESDNLKDSPIEIRIKEKGPIWELIASTKDFRPYELLGDKWQFAKELNFQEFQLNFDFDSLQIFKGHLAGTLNYPINNVEPSSMQNLLGSKIDFSLILEGEKKDSTLLFEIFNLEIQGSKMDPNNPIRIALLPFEISLKSPLALPDFSGKAGLDHYNLQKGTNGSKEINFRLEDLEADWSFDGSSEGMQLKDLKYKLNGMIAGGASPKEKESEKRGFITLEGKIQNLLSSKPLIDSTLKINNFPSQFFNQFSQCKEWDLLLGPSVDFQAIVLSKNDSSTVVNLSLHGSKVDGRGIFDFKKQIGTDCKLTFDLFGKTDSQAQYQLTVSGEVNNLLTESNRLNKEPSISLDIHSSKLPTLLLCHVSYLSPNLKEQIHALIGHQLDIALKAKLDHMNGPVQMSIQGSQGKIAFDGSVENFILALNKPLHAEFEVTPILSEKLLADLVPPLSSVTRAEKPVKIVIDPINFSFPIKDFDLKQIVIEKASIDLGKMFFSGEGQLGQILSLLNASQANSEKELNVWFTPLYFSMKEGKVRCDRMDALLTNHFPIALWGKVDLSKKKISMIIGITATALRNAFGIKGLKDDFMLQVPLKGDLGKAAIDKVKTTARISALVAQSQGGTKGFILGNVLEIVTGGYGDKEIPPSTTDPLPWNKP